jgi:S-disulfanyl-L-cysteine oxidoreductase SoxD
MFRFPNFLSGKNRSRFLAPPKGGLRRKAARNDIALLLIVFTFQGAVFAQEKFSGIGRAATPAEIKAWDIDVRPDFKGLPAGSGSVAKGQQVWESKCESCHGTFGESNEVFTPMAGGTSTKDMETGRVATLKRADFPQRSTLMKLSQLSTLWDYINRAMPWNAPKSLTTEEVYAVTAYILNLGEIVSTDFVLSEKNIRDVQAKLPNRNGMIEFAALWNVQDKADVKNIACMANCESDVRVTSSIPDFALNQHGNLAEQSRLIGATRGINTSGANAPSASAPISLSAAELAKNNACAACHAPNSKLIGPSLADIASKYKGDAEAGTKLAAKIKVGGSGVWGVTPMPSHLHLSDTDLQALVQWSLSGGKVF